MAIDIWINSTKLIIIVASQTSDCKIVSIRGSYKQEIATNSLQNEVNNQDTLFLYSWYLLRPISLLYNMCTKSMLRL